MLFKSSKKIDVDKVNQKIVEIVCKVIFVVVVLLGSYTIIDNVKHIMNLNIPREIGSEKLKKFKSLVREFNKKVDLIENMKSDSYTEEELKTLKKNFKELKEEINLSKLNDINGGYYNSSEYFEIMYGGYDGASLIGVTGSGNSVKIIDIISKHLKYPELEKSMIRNGRYVMGLNGAVNKEYDNIVFHGGNRNFYLIEPIYYPDNDGVIMNINVYVMNYYVDLADIVLEIGGGNND